MDGILSKDYQEQDRLLGNSILRKFDQKDGFYQIPGQNKQNTSTILGESTLGLHL